ncbi:hypothetical protein HJG60_009035 [Phyllostomus discolor]|uniref:Uncharacterized protein n=1 Tax=Phyllostomus discolor TaxID=89673 RepID=A0A833YF63_9CHIR|nr:hypothetical protein HJG60_009035 [Phyllostomus discolor]
MDCSPQHSELREWLAGTHLGQRGQPVYRTGPMSRSRADLCPAALSPAPSQCALESTGVQAAFRGWAALGVSRRLVLDLWEGGGPRSRERGMWICPKFSAALHIRYQPPIKSVFPSCDMLRG